MTLRVISDGLERTTHFEDCTTGEPVTIEGVKSVEWKQGRGPAVLVIELHSFELRAKGIVLPARKTEEEEDESSHRIS
jgi:hypothetical protein